MESQMDCEFKSSEEEIMVNTESNQLPSLTLDFDDNTIPLAVNPSQPEKSTTKRNFDTETNCELNKKLTRVMSRQLKTEASGKYFVQRRKSTRQKGKKMDDMEGGQECHWDRLPTELVTTIFEYLTVQDRKVARLVCRNWNNCLNATTKEKLLCCALFGAAAVIRTIKQSQRQHLNLEFHDMDFCNQRGINFWLDCGWKIKSLMLFECKLAGYTIGFILQKCPNLKTLFIENLKSKKLLDGLCSDNCVSDLINRKVINESLTHFELNVDQTSLISNRFLLGIRTACPNMKHVSFHCSAIEVYCMKGEVEDRELLHSLSRLTFYGIMDTFIFFQNQLQFISLEVTHYFRSRNELGAAEMNNAITSFYFPKLRVVKFDLWVSTKQLLKDPVIGFFRQHSQLTSITCNIFIKSSLDNLTIDPFIESLLDLCPQLQCLNIILLATPITTINPLSPSICKRIANSKLISLTFNFDLKIAPTDIELVNNQLKTLCIKLPGVNKNAFLVMSQIFRSLVHLEVPSVDNDCLQSIFQYQCSLQTLKVVVDQHCTDFGFTGRSPDGKIQGFSIRRLTQLRYLDLNLIKSHPERTEMTIINELELPNLLYLHLAICREWTLMIYFAKAISSNLPKLEAVTFDVSCEIDYVVWFELCCKMKNLKFLHILSNKREKYDESNYILLFESCPTLRAVVHQYRARWVSYYYNVVNGRVLKKTKGSFVGRVSSEQTHLFLENWMRF